MNHKLKEDLDTLSKDQLKEVKEFVKSLKLKNPNKRPLGLAKGMVEIKDDFDDHIPGFEPYMK